ncbi:MAG: hypothetical protein HKN14_09150 [Marinicaulis sp.]|nr:hypothetical protein [Marinicaulis sp.]
MSDRLPVADTLNEAFRFGLKRWGTVFRYVWVPFLITIAMFGSIAAAGLNFEAFETLENVENGGEFPGWDELFAMPLKTLGMLFIVAAIISWILFSGFMASIYRLVALGEERPGLFQLRLDGPAWRVFWSHVILQIINYGLLFIGMAIAMPMVGSSFAELFGVFGEIFRLAAENPNYTPSDEESWELLKPFAGIGLGILFAALPMMYVNIKLVPFPPGSAVENRLFLFGAFRITTGHAWSVFGILVLTFLALAIASTIVQLVAAIFETIAALSGGGALGVIAIVAMVIQLTMLFVFQAFAYAVQFGVAGVIYRRLKTGA